MAFCRVCLSENVRMHSIANIAVLEIFERLTDTKFYSEDRKPGSICYICHAQLRRCHRFYVMCHRAEEILTDLLRNGLEISYKTIFMLNLTLRNNLKQPAIEAVSVDGYIQMMKNQVSIKEEPIENVENDTKITIKIEGTAQEYQCPTICRVCLVTNVRMYGIKEIGLQELFEKVTNIKLSSAEGRPLTICYVCRPQLLTCCSFSTTHHRAQQVLADLYTNGFEVSLKSINIFNLKITPHLSRTATQFMCFEDSSNVSATVAVKEEVFEQEEHIDGTRNCRKKPPKSNLKIRKKVKLKCDKCSDTFTWKSALDKHIERSHTRCVCDLCQKPFCNKMSLTNHIRKVHAEKKECICQYCNRTYPTDYCLHRHIILKHSGKSFACTVCNKEFTFKTSMLRHMNTHKSEIPLKKFKCNNCDMAFVSKRQLLRHKTIHTGERLHACDTCNKEFASAANLKRHQLIHTGQKPYACDTCSKAFSDTSILLRHQKIHSGDKPFACNQCDMKFIVKLSLISHLRTHTGLKPYACGECARAFTDHNHLNRHMKIHEQNTCIVCGMTFPRKGLLDKHMKSHKTSPDSQMANEISDSMLDYCNKCQKVFGSHAALIRHMKRHSGLKPYACRVCDMRFPEKRSMVRHMIIHTGEKPFACDECNKNFRTKFTMKRHVQTHTGEKPYSCDHCGARYADKTYVGKHIVKEHLKKDNKLRSKKKNSKSEKR